MAEYVKRVTVEGVRVTVYPDSPENPRKEDNLGTIVGLYNSSVDLGDHSYNNWQEFIMELAEKDNLSDYRIGNKSPSECIKEVAPGIVYQKLFLKDNLLTLEAKGRSFGYMYVMKADVIKEYGKYDDESIKRAKDVMGAELDLYNLYILGIGYGYELESITVCEHCGQEVAQDIDSCWGFYTIEDIVEELRYGGFQLLADKLKEEI